MNKIFQWLQRWLPGVWAVLMLFTITGVLFALGIQVVQWIVNLLLGVL